MDEVTRQLTEAIVKLGEVLHPVLEAAGGYRAKALELGFAPEVADLMAAEYHSALLARIAQGLMDGA